MIKKENFRSVLTEMSKGEIRIDTQICRAFLFGNYWYPLNLFVQKAVSLETPGKTVDVEKAICQVLKNPIIADRRFDGRPVQADDKDIIERSLWIELL